MSDVPRKISSLIELNVFASDMVKKFSVRQVVLLNGQMGAGKTQLVRFIVEAMGGKAVSSPTFAIHNEYATPLGPVDHVDLYRLESESELEATGFWDLFSRDSGLILVEWADRLDAGVWPPSWDTIKVVIEIAPNNCRSIKTS